MSRELHRAIAEAARLAVLTERRHDVWQHPDHEERVHVCRSAAWWSEMSQGDRDAYVLIGSATLDDWESHT